MKFEPMIKVLMRNYQKQYEKEELDDAKAFEYFVNYTILKSHQPEAFSTSNELADLICVDGKDDMGIDGIAIKVNGIFISSKHDINDFIKQQKKIDIEFIFIQSKYKEKFDSGEYGKYMDGVKDFLQEEHFEPRNDKIDFWLELKDYLLSYDIISAWRELPNIRLYYVVNGTWQNNEYIIAKTNQLKNDIKAMNSYGETFERYIDNAALKTMCNENDNNFTAVLNTIDSFSLTEVKNVDSSMIIMCNAVEIIKMLESSDNLLRKSIFTDNVRDFQGDTAINEEIYQTIILSPQSFVLVNNGITIVCSNVLFSNRKVTITNPQVVNGCQTCNVLFKAYMNGVDLSSVVVITKIISTNENEITNQIVKGTNKQNIVYDEAFEITRDFHKNLEDFMLAMPEINDVDRIYYERRSKQYSNNPTIKATQKVNFRSLIQSFVSLFLKSPHFGIRHEKTLLQKYQNIIFVDNQSLYPYYVAPAINNALETIYRQFSEYKWCFTYKYHLLFIICVRSTGFPPNINNTKQIDEYCTRVMTLLNSGETLKNSLNNAIELFNNIVNAWCLEKGESYRHGVKDSADFTAYLCKFIEKSSNVENTQTVVYRGTVVSVRFDKNGKYYAFISRLPENIFCHSDSNPDINFSNVYAKDVLYIINTNNHGQIHAIITKVI